MNNEEITQKFEVLYTGLQQEINDFFTNPPLLAHYTTLDTLENILVSNEVWFSNPLFMNDLEEVRFGIVEGANALKTNSNIKTALGTDVRHEIFIHALDHYIANFEEEHLLDTYVFCLSEHKNDDTDGKLSMWRGYGGNGNGAAIVFDSAKFNQLDNSPLIIGKVHYGSYEDRNNWFNELGELLVKILEENDISDDQIYLTSHSVFERLKLFSLYTKHSGFIEEDEWRVVYLSDRDHQNKLTHMRHYYNGPRGVEPKLKFKIEPLKDFTTDDFCFEKIVASILLGPSTSSLLAELSIKRMLEVIGKPELNDRIVASSIPLRPA